MINLNVQPNEIAHDTYFHGNSKQIAIFGVFSVEDALGIADLDYHDAGVIMLDWAKMHNIGYYADVREHFFMYKAVEIACLSGYDGMIVEDLS
jgi:hypothetical protein